MGDTRPITHPMPADGAESGRVADPGTAAIVSVDKPTVISTTAEEFGGPCQVGTTDTRAACICVSVFAGLILVTAGGHLGADSRLARHFSGPWALLASGPNEG